MTRLARTALVLAVLLLAVDGYLLYRFYAETTRPGAGETVTGAAPARTAVSRSEPADRDQYLDGVEEIQGRSVEALLETHDRMLRYDALTGDDVEAMQAARDTLGGQRTRAEELRPPEEYGEQYDAFRFALGDMHNACATAHRLAADPASAMQADFTAYELQVQRAEENLRRSNDLLGQNYETIGDVQMPSSGV